MCYLIYSARTCKSWIFFWQLHFASWAKKIIIFLMLIFFLAKLLSISLKFRKNQWFYVRKNTKHLTIFFLKVLCLAKFFKMLFSQPPLLWAHPQHCQSPFENYLMLQNIYIFFFSNIGFFELYEYIGIKSIDFSMKEIITYSG